MQRNWLKVLIAARAWLGGNALARRSGVTGDRTGENATIEAYQRRVDATDPADPMLACRLCDLGGAYKRRFDRSGTLADLDNAVGAYRRGVAATPRDRTHARDHLTRYLSVLNARRELGADPPLVNEIVRVHRLLVGATPVGSPAHCYRLCELGAQLRGRFDRSRQLPDLAEAVEAYRRGTAALPDGDAQLLTHLDRRAEVLGALGEARSARPGVVTESELVTEIIGVRRRIVAGTPAGHPDLPARLVELAVMLAGRAGLGVPSPTELAEARALIDRATSPGTGRHAGLACALSNAANTLMTPADGVELARFDEALDLHRRAVRTTPDGHPHRVDHRDRLQRALALRHRRGGTDALLDERVGVLRELVRAIPETDPRRFGYLADLTNAVFQRYRRTDDLDTLAEAVDLHRELTSVPSPSGEPAPHLVISLGGLLLLLFQQTGEPETLKEGVTVARGAARIVAPDSPHRSLVLSNLATALWLERGNAHRVGGASGGDDDSAAADDEMIAVLREALAIAAADDENRAPMLSNLGVMLRGRYARTRVPAVLDEAVAALRAAAEAPSDAAHRILSLTNLADVLLDRLALAEDHAGGGRADLDELVGVRRRLVGLLPAGSAGHILHSALLGEALDRWYARTGETAALDEVVDIHRHIADGTPADHEDRPCRLARLGTVLLRRARATADQGEIERAALLAVRRAVEATPGGHKHRHQHLTDLVEVLGPVAQRTREPALVAELAEVLREVVDTAEPADGRLFRHLVNLGSSLAYLGYSVRPELLAEAVDVFRQATTLAPAGSAEQVTSLVELACVLLTLTITADDPEALGEAAEVSRRAVAAIAHPAAPAAPAAGGTAEEEPVYLRRLGDLATALISGGARTGQPELFEAAAEVCVVLVATVPGDDARRPKYLTMLGTASLECHSYTGSLDRLNRAVDALRSAVAATPDGDGERCCRLIGLASAMLRLARHTGEPRWLEEAVKTAQEGVMAPPPDPGHHPLHTNDLGNVLIARFEASGDHSMLAEAEQKFRAALATAASDDPMRTAYLANLATALRLRYQRTGELTVLDEATELADAALRASGELVHTDVVLSVAQTWAERHGHDGGSDWLARALDASRSVLAATPAGHAQRPEYLFRLAGSLLRHYQRSGRAAELNGAVQTAREAVNSAPPGDTHRAGYLDLLAAVLVARYERTGALASLDEAIEAHEKAVGAVAAGDTHRAGYLSNFAVALAARTRRADGEAPSGEAGSRDGAGPLERSIELLREAVDSTGVGDTRRGAYLTNLAIHLTDHYRRTGDPWLADEAVRRAWQAYDATPESDPERASRLNNVARALTARYEREGDPARLDEVVALFRRVVATGPEDDPRRIGYLTGLAHALLAVHRRDGREPGSLAEAIALFERAAGIAGASPTQRVEACGSWGRAAAHAGDWAQALRALSRAVEELPRLAPRALSRADQEHLLARTVGLASDAAACAVRLGEPGRAVELLEAGRGVLLAQAMAFHADTAELARRHPDLAAQLDGLRFALDPDPGASLDAFNAEVVERREEQDAQWWRLVEQVRQLAGFEDFLRPPRLSDLLEQAADGPIVLVNVSALGSQALLLTGAGAGDGSGAGVGVGVGVGVVPLPDASPDALRAQLERVQEALDALDGVGGGGNEPGSTREWAERRLHEVLGWLWDAVAGPVLGRLRFAGASEPGDDLPRIWWSPTGPLALLPLHAAGHHLQRDQVPVSPTVLDRVVSSYTPTVSVLRYLRGRPRATGRDRRALVVGMQETPGRPNLPGAGIEAQIISARFGDVSKLDGRYATRPKVLTQLPAFSWAHFACHAVTDPRRPSASHLVLDDHATHPLTVADIARLDLLDAELAFLSACGTARTGPELADEALHLASAFQLAGFRHVIGTLWRVNDTYAVLVAEQMYSMLVPDGEPDATRAAFTLHGVTRARRNEAPDRPSRWAAHLHAGA